MGTPALSEAFGIFCNYSGDGYVAHGARACLAQLNGGGERWEFVVKSRGGRMIRRYLRLDRCSGFRVKFVAPRFRRAGMLLYPDRPAAETLLARWEPEPCKAAERGADGG